MIQPPTDIQSTSCPTAGLKCSNYFLKCTQFVRTTKAVMMDNQGHDWSSWVLQWAVVTCGIGCNALCLFVPPQRAGFPELKRGSPPRPEGLTCRRKHKRNKNACAVYVQLCCVWSVNWGILWNNFKNILHVTHFNVMEIVIPSVLSVMDSSSSGRSRDSSATVAGFVLKRRCVAGQCSGAVPLTDVLICGVEGLLFFFI